VRKINNIFYKIFILILIIIFIYSFSASYTSLNLDNLAFVVALGIDKSTSNKLKVTFQFIKPTPSSEGGSQTKPVLTSVECSSITNGINIMNAYLGKKVNLSHCKLIIFSEEIAKDGISDEIYSLINEVQIRPSANIIISKCNTKYYIENSVPSLESLIPKYYNIFPHSSEYTGYTCDATIGDFFNALVCNSCAPYAMLGGISSFNEDSSSNPESLNDSTIKSNESLVTGNRLSQNIGVAVFKNDKLAGELNAIETICFLNIRKQVDSFLVSIPDPENSNSKIDIYLTPNSTHNISVNIVNGTPYIKIKFDFSGKIYSMTKGSEYLNTDVLDSISTTCNKYLKEQFTNYLYKTATTFDSDINGFGVYSLSQFKTSTEFDDYNWLVNYKNSTFDVDINTVMDSGFLLTQT
jgi:spore germination protein KC